MPATIWTIISFDPLHDSQPRVVITTRKLTKDAPPLAA